MHNGFWSGSCECTTALTGKDIQTIADCCPHPALEPLPLFQSQSVRLGDDRNHVDLVVDGLHELDVQGLQAGCTGDRWDSGQRQTSDFSISANGEVDREKVLALREAFGAARVTRGRVER